jgi:hypothetical protein
MLIHIQYLILHIFLEPRKQRSIKICLYSYEAYYVLNLLLLSPNSYTFTCYETRPAYKPINNKKRHNEPISPTFVRQDLLFIRSQSPQNGNHITCGAEKAPQVRFF